MHGLRGTMIAASLAIAALATAAAAASASSASLTGHGHGTWKVKPNNIPDVGTQENLRGHGHFSIGDVRIRGAVSAPGFVVEGSCHVSLRLMTESGTIKVVGHSKTESRSTGSICDGHAFRFRFHTTGATGTLAGSSYKGIGVFDVKDASDSAADHGTFTLTLKS